LSQNIQRGKRLRLLAAGVVQFYGYEGTSGFTIEPIQCNSLRETLLLWIRPFAERYVLSLTALMCKAFIKGVSSTQVTQIGCLDPTKH